MDNLGTESTRGSDATLARSARDAGADAAAVLFEETLPFPPPVRRAASSHTSAAPVAEPLSLEQLTEAQLAAARAEAAGESAALQLALAAPIAAQQSLATLRWRGMELSPEFQAYAARVARGEQLEPYRGQVLAQPGAPFPWEASGATPSRSRAPRVLMLLLLALCVVAAVTGNVGMSEEPALLGSGQAVRAAEAAAFASQSAAPAPAQAPADPAPKPSPRLEPPAAPVTPAAEQVAPAPKLAAPRPARPRAAAAAAPVAPASADDTSLLVEKAPF